MSWELIGIPIGIVFLYFGSEWMVDGAKKIAFRLGIAPFVVGLTVVAFGSSAPEAITSLVSANNPQIIAGNIVGSNIANVGIAIGLSALMAPLACKYKEIRFELITMMAASIGITLLATMGAIGWPVGLVLIAILFAFVYTVYRMKVSDASDPELEKEAAENTTPLWKSAIMVVLGIACLYIGAKAFIAGAVELASMIGISDLLVGLIVVAIGTSLPEICICILGARRREVDLVISNIVGSNIFNALFVLGVGSLVTDVPFTEYMVIFHMPVMILLSAMLFAMIYKNNSVGKKGGALLLGVYFVYIALMAVFPQLTSGIM